MQGTQVACERSSDTSKGGVGGARLRRDAQARHDHERMCSAWAGRYVGHMAGVDERAGPATSRWTLRRPGPRGGITPGDLLLAGVVLVLQVGLTVVADVHHHHQSRLDVAEWLLLLVGPLALLTWRRHPVMVLWVTFLATVGPAAPRFSYLSLIVAFFLAATSGTCTRPEVGASVVVRIEAVVVFPAPFGPRRQNS
jgi:hypothetical protein